MPIVLATAGDAPLLARYRVAMFRDMNRIAPSDEAALEGESAHTLRAAIARGEYVAWLLLDDAGTPIGSAGLLIRSMLPRPAAGAGKLLIGREGLVVNVFIDPAWRRRGLARQLMEAVIAWGRAEGLARLVLHASDDGRPLYEALGFSPTREMSLEC